VEFRTLAEYRDAAGRVGRGDTVYVDAALYRALPAGEREWLWRHALSARAQLVTDLDTEAPIIVRRGDERRAVVRRRWGDD
jgi:hypothetical protein